ARPERPDSRESAEEGALPAAGRTRDENPVAGLDGEARIREQHAAVRQREVQLLRTDGVAWRAHDGDAAGGTLGLGSLERLIEGEQAVHARTPAGQVGVALDEPAEGVLHPPERGGDLEEASERDGAGEEARRSDHDREDDGQLSVADGEPGEALRIFHERPPVEPDALEAVEEPDLLVRFSAVERHSFGVLAQADEAVAEIRLEALLLEVERDEGTTYQMRQDASEQRVHDGGPDHVPRDR